MEKLLKESLMKLQEECVESDKFTRWELGACWIQHLQDQKKTEKDKKASTEKVKVEGLGTALRSLKNKKKDLEGSTKVVDVVNGEVENSVLDFVVESPNSDENENALKKLLSDAAFTRLKESETGLHCKVVLKLKYYMCTYLYSIAY